MQSIKTIILLTGFLLMVQTNAHACGDTPTLAMDVEETYSDPQAIELAEAASDGDIDEILDWLAKGVDVNVKGKCNLTPLFFAFQAAEKEAFKVLLEHGADPNVVWTTGGSVMYWVAGARETFFLETALAHGGNPNLPNNTGETPIFQAVEPAGKANLPILIEHGADLNHQTTIGKVTPMMAAAALNQYDAVYMLLQAGANYMLRDHPNIYGVHHDIRWSIRHSCNIVKTSDGWYWREKVIDFLNSRGFIVYDEGEVHDCTAQDITDWGEWYKNH